MYKNVVFPYPSFEHLPLNIYHFEYINQTEIQYKDFYDIENKRVFLRSAVYLETHLVNEKEIVLCTGAIIKQVIEDISTGISYKYSPKVSFNNNNSNGDVLVKIQNPDDYLKTKGTIFIYSI
jgi:hypothetical protein